MQCLPAETSKNRLVSSPAVQTLKKKRLYSIALVFFQTGTDSSDVYHQQAGIILHPVHPHTKPKSCLGGVCTGPQNVDLRHSQMLPAEGYFSWTAKNSSRPLLRNTKKALKANGTLPVSEEVSGCQALVQRRLLT